MGDVEIDTAPEPVGDGRYRAGCMGDWEIWGPCGGYVAAIALRAAGAESPSPVPPASSATTSPWPPSRRWTSWSPRCAPAGPCWPSASR